MNWPMTRRATSVSIASSSGSSNRTDPSPAATALMTTSGSSDDLGSEPDRLPLRIARGGIEAGLRSGIGRGIGRQPRPLADDPAQLANLELRSLVAKERQRQPLAAEVGERNVDGVQPFLEKRRAEQRLAVRGDDLRAAPEGDRLVHAHAVAEDDDRGRQLGEGSHQR